MRFPLLLLGVVGALWLACASDPPEIEVGAGGEGGDSGPDHFVDEEGVCRSKRPLDDHLHLGCPPSFEEAKALDRCGAAVCIGACGRWLAYQDACTPSLGCSYDPDSGALVGGVLGGDDTDYCDRSSAEFIFADGHHGCSFDPDEVDPSCPFVAAP